MKLIIVIVFKILALIFLVVAAALDGGMFTSPGAGWLLAGGLASWCLASLIESLPIRETP